MVFRAGRDVCRRWASLASATLRGAAPARVHKPFKPIHPPRERFLGEVDGSSLVRYVNKAARKAIRTLMSRATPTVRSRKHVIPSVHIGTPTTVLVPQRATDFDGQPPRVSRMLPR